MRPEDQDDYRDRAGRADRREAMPPILGQVVNLGHFPPDDESRHVYAFRALVGDFERAERGQLRLSLVGDPLFAVDLTPAGAGARPQAGDQHILRWTGNRLAFSGASRGGKLAVTVIGSSYAWQPAPFTDHEFRRPDPPTNGFHPEKGDGTRFDISFYLGVWYNPDYDPGDPDSGPETEVAVPGKEPPWSDHTLYRDDDPFWSGPMDNIPPPHDMNLDLGYPAHAPGDTVAGGLDVFPGGRRWIFYRVKDTADDYGFPYEFYGSVRFDNDGEQKLTIGFVIHRFNVTAQDRLKWLCPPVHHPREFDPVGRLQSFAGIAATFDATAVMPHPPPKRLPGREPIVTRWPVSWTTDTGEALAEGDEDAAAASEGMAVIRVPPWDSDAWGDVLDGKITVTADGYVPATMMVHTQPGSPFSAEIYIGIAVLNPYPLLFCKDDMDGYTGSGDEPTLPACFPRKLSLTFWKTAVSASMNTTVNLARYPGCATADGFEWLGDYAGEEGAAEEVTIEIHARTADPYYPVTYQADCRKDYKWGRRSLGGSPIPFKSARLSAVFNPATGGGGQVHGFYLADDCTGNGGDFVWFQLKLPACKDDEDRPTTGPIYLFNRFYYFGSSAFVCYYYPNIFSTLPEPVAIYDMQIGVWSIED